jgi:hypothetical protein
LRGIGCPLGIAQYPECHGMQAVDPTGRQRSERVAIASLRQHHEVLHARPLWWHRSNGGAQD